MANPVPAGSDVPEGTYCCTHGGDELGEASIDAVVGALVDLDRDLADDLLLAIKAYTEAETRLVALDGSAGRNVSRRIERLRRLGYVRNPLERELGA